jgi:hypothetical protein
MQFFTVPVGSLFKNLKANGSDVFVEVNAILDAKPRRDNLWIVADILK